LNISPTLAKSNHYFGESSDAAVVIQVSADMLFEDADELMEDALQASDFAFEIGDPLVQRAGLFSVVGKLALLIEIPEQPHGRSSPS
jgi:hypothetical protein